MDPIPTCVELKVAVYMKGMKSQSCFVICQNIRKNLISMLSYKSLLLNNCSGNWCFCWNFWVFYADLEGSSCSVFAAAPQTKHAQGESKHTFFSNFRWLPANSCFSYPHTVTLPFPSIWKCHFSAHMFNSFSHVIIFIGSCKTERHTPIQVGYGL